MRLIRIAIIALAISSGVGNLYSQQKPKRVKKEEVLTVLPSSTNPFASKATLPEDNELAWKELTDVSASFKISFPGEPL